MKLLSPSLLALLPSTLAAHPGHVHFFGHGMTHGFGATLFAMGLVLATYLLYQIRRRRAR